ncbi:MAG: hypothetical protein JKX69_07290 [Rhodobacteraceae bacterium]|nr:hypothetical protein [Paracoccaceae bacterium]
MFTKSIFLSAALALPMSAAQAAAQSLSCDAHATVVTRLAAGYGESRQSIALGANNTVVEIFASLDTGTWTITVTQPGGPTCLVAAGQAFEHVTEPLPNTDPGA